MRTIYPVLVILALGTAAAIWSFSGIAGVYTERSISELQSDEALVNASDESPASQNGSLSGGANSGQGSGDIIGLILSSTGVVTQIVATIVLLPGELQALGAPWWVAEPVGRLAQVIAGVGVIQFASNRRWI